MSSIVIARREASKQALMVASGAVAICLDSLDCNDSDDACFCQVCLGNHVTRLFTRLPLDSPVPIEGHLQ